MRPCPSPVGKSIARVASGSDYHAGSTKMRAVLFESPGQQVIGADGRHHEARGHHRANHVVEVLPECPRVQNQSPETLEQYIVAGAELVADWMLHPRIGSDDEKSGKPRAEEDQKSREPVHHRTQPLLAKDEQAQKGGLQEERENALHAPESDRSRRRRSFEKCAQLVPN